MGAFHWERTPLGPAHAWPVALRSAVRLMLSTPEPMWITWGPGQTCLYNDACATSVLGRRHPAALGKSAPEAWGEAWLPIVESTRRRSGSGPGETDSQSDPVPFLVSRDNLLEELFFNFACSPISEDLSSGAVWRATDETESVIAGRRAALLYDVANEMAGATSEEGMLLAVEACLDRESHDIPFALIYVMDGTDQRLAASVGLTAAQMRTIPAEFLRTVRDWSATRSRHEVVVEPAPPGLAWPAGPWQRPATRIAMMPLVPPGGHALGSLVAGLNPHRPVDPSYRRFLTTLSALVGAGLGSVAARDADRVVGVTEEALAALGHELRAPLNAILAWAQILSGGAEPADRKRGIETIQRSALVQARLIDDLFATGHTISQESALSRVSVEPSETGVADADLHDTVVLVVDDEEEARQATVRVLENAHAEVLEAASASEALEYLRARRIDLIVSDLSMPTVDGYSFLVAVRNQPKARGGCTPAIALSSRSRSIDRQRALRAGFQLYLTKPAESAELVLAAASVAGRLKSRSR